MSRSPSEGGRSSSILSQILFDLPHDLSPLPSIGLGRLLVDQSVGLGVAIASIVALRPTKIVLVEHLVGIIEPRFGDGEPFVWPVAEFLHNLLGLFTILRDVRVIAR